MIVKPADLPPDIFWPIRVVVTERGGCVPYHLMLLWHYQWFTRAHGEA